MNTLRVDFDNARLVMDRAFAKKAMIVGSDEYRMLKEAKESYPSYQVVRKTIKANPNKEAYRGLTYEYMEMYIQSHDNCVENMKEYKELRLLAECHSIRYPRIKQWFLNAYPAVSKYGMESESDRCNSVYKVVKTA